MLHTPRPESDSEPTVPIAMRGPSAGAVRARAALDALADERTPVLVVAEPGSRPRDVAIALHARAGNGAPLVAIDCAGADALEIEERLFGAPPRRPAANDLESASDDCAVMRARGGTLFLNHVGDLPASAQRRLARVLRDGEVRTSSSRTPVRVKFRVVAAGPADLEAEVRDGRFRADLARRLSATRLVVPPLRHRAEDFSAIVEALCIEIGGTPRPFTQAALTVLGALPWPGNLDELAGVLSRLLAEAGGTIRQEDVLAHLPIDGTFARVDLTTSLREARRRFEREYIAAVLERHDWRMSEAARALGIERANLYRKTRQLGIARVPRAAVS